MPSVLDLPPEVRDRRLAKMGLTLEQAKIKFAQYDEIQKNIDPNGFNSGKPDSPGWSDDQIVGYVATDDSV